MAYHQRSASLPSLPACSIESSVEEELQALKSCTAISSSPPSATTIDAARDGLRRLGGVYGSVEEMLRLPSTQLGLSLSRQREAVEEELDRSLELIDLCSATQESVAEMKACVQDLLRLALKRGGDAAAARVKAESFVRLLAKKAAQKAPVMKKTSGGGKAGVEERCRVIGVMAEAREAAVALLETTSRLLPRQIIGGVPHRSASKWSLVSARFQKRKAVVCEEQQLRALESSVGELEEGVEVLFRRLIQSRVSLLNILSS